MHVDNTAAAALIYNGIDYLGRPCGKSFATADGGSAELGSMSVFVAAGGATDVTAVIYCDTSCPTEDKILVRLRDVCCLDVFTLTMGVCGPVLRRRGRHLRARGLQHRRADGDGAFGARLELLRLELRHRVRVVAAVHLLHPEPQQHAVGRGGERDGLADVDDVVRVYRELGMGDLRLHHRRRALQAARRWRRCRWSDPCLCPQLVFSFVYLKLLELFAKPLTQIAIIVIGVALVVSGYMLMKHADTLKAGNPDGYDSDWSWQTSFYGSIAIFVLAGLYFLLMCFMWSRFMLAIDCMVRHGAMPPSLGFLPHHAPACYNVLRRTWPVMRWAAHRRS